MHYNEKNGGNAASHGYLKKLEFVQEGLIGRCVRGCGGIVSNDMIFSMLKDEA